MSLEGIKNKIDIKKAVIYLLCGVLIGIGAQLPGVSGGVLCVIFGIYRPIMDLLSNPFKALRRQAPIVVPTVIGIGVGILAAAKLLSFLLGNPTYEGPSVCVFVGLIAGTIPSLFKEAGEKGRKAVDFVALFIAFAVLLTLLITLKLVEFEVKPNIPWFIFAGFCMALSIIVPGMSFSTLLMPLGLYTPLNDGISGFDFSVLIPVGIGALLTVILLARLADWLLTNHHGLAFHSIIGIVIAATAVIIPFDSFTKGVTSVIVNIVCILAGVGISVLFSIAEKKTGTGADQKPS